MSYGKSDESFSNGANGVEPTRSYDEKRIVYHVR